MDGSDPDDPREPATAPTGPGRARGPGRHRALAIAATVPVAVGVAGDVLLGGEGILTGLALVVVAVAAALALWDERRHGHPRRAGGRRAVAHLALASVLVGIAIQAVPYGRAHSNPPVTGEPDWATPRTRELMVRACYACHSNEVDWPWYSSVAPLSWITTRHVEEGREEVNYSEFATRGGSDDTIEVLLEGSMPPSYFTRFGLNPDAELSRAEILELIEGLRATPGITDERDDDDHDD